MDQALRETLDSLHRAGRAHDAAQPDRTRQLRNLEPEAAELLTVVLRIAGSRRVVEIGTSNGYSAIWLADAIRDTGGRVTSVDIEAWPGLHDNLAAARVASLVDLVVADGGEYLSRLADDTVDLLFLDAERVEYPSWWPHPARVLRPGGVLAIDNVLSHPDEVAPLLALIAAEGRFVSTTAAVGKGLYLAWRRA